MSSGFLPDATRDELLYGLLGRQRRLIGAPAGACHIADLFGTRSAVASPCLQGRLGDLAARLDVPGLDALHLLNAHTLFPYYTAFQPAEVKDTCQRELVGSTGSSAYVKLGLAAFGIGASRTKLLVCPSCHRQQLEELGSPTWLRSHQVPGSVVCHLHGDVLVVGNVAQGRDGRRHEFTWLCDQAPPLLAAPWNDQQFDLLTDIARRQAEIVNGGRQTRRLSEWKLFYRERLASRGLMRSAQKVDHGRLAGAIEDALGPVLPLLPSQCGMLGESGWPGLIVREHRKAMHPLIHVLMETVLDLTPKVRQTRALPASRPRLRTSSKRRAPRMSLGRRRDWSSEDSLAVLRLRHSKKVLLGLKPPRRVTFAALQRHACGRDWISKRKTLLPRAFKAAQDLSEDSETFLARRLSYWSATLGDVPAWRILRAAGVRHQRWPEAMDLIRRFEGAVAVCRAA